MNVSPLLMTIMEKSIKYAEQNNYEYITPEVLLYKICKLENFKDAFEDCGGNIKKLKKDLKEYMEETLAIPFKVKSSFSYSAINLLETAERYALSSGKNATDIHHLIYALWELQNSYALYYIKLQGIEKTELIQELMFYQESESAYTIDFDLEEEDFDSCDENIQEDDLEGWVEHLKSDYIFSEGEDDESINDFYMNDSGLNSGTFNQKNGGESEKKGKNKGKSVIAEYAPCLNDIAKHVNPLIGRNDELDRTIQVLCRKDKNNPIHIGEPGVGKTAITNGLACLINEDKVPDELKGARIYSLDLGSLLAGTQYRGEFEKRLKKVLKHISAEENPIIYIDEIHNLCGAGATGDSSLDASNLLKPYLAEGHIRFIGATTFEEYKKYFEKNKSLVRRFQNIEISEPSIDETVQILEGVKAKYAEYHGVSYSSDIIKYIVKMSQKYINERFLPDKAIDLMDEVGAYKKIYFAKIDKLVDSAPIDDNSTENVENKDGNSKVICDKEIEQENVETKDGKEQIEINTEDVNYILTKICRVPLEATKQEDESNLMTLNNRISSKVFGQDEAIAQVVNAVKFSKAGLLANNKPLSSFLFVGPTGVGKTEIARTLADELGVKLIRFDMSEYGEKHSIAKLIGAPAGYVGYDEGGLLTEAVRKNPSCVLLLDEIEKAHPDIYHVLLQVMDYATLTDNQGRKADFRNVIIIMTSNAGASQIGKTGLGFRSTDVTPDIIMEEVKHIFQPEFRNRLNKIVVFSGITDEMANLIAKKKLEELKTMLKSRNVDFSYGQEAIELVTKKGISKEFGAREIDRIIQNDIKPLFVDELLFGKLKQGGKCTLEIDNDSFKIIIC